MAIIPRVSGAGSQASSHGVSAGGFNTFQYMNLGDVAAATGNKYVGIFAQIKERANVAMSQDASLQLSQFGSNLMNDPKTGLLAQQGKNAIGKGQEYATAFDSKAEELAASLPDEASRNMFMQQAQQQRIQFTTQAGRHEIGQINAYQEGQFQAMLSTNAEKAAMMYGDNPGYISVHQQTFQQIDQFGAAQGWSDEQITAKKIKFKELTADKALSSWSANQSIEFINSNGELSDTAGGSRRAVMDSDQPLGVRGVRNNNPGNLEFSPSNPWVGQTGSDGRFAQFETPEHGIRALGRNLLSYQRQGIDTINDIITRWAPPKDNNNTAEYIKFVCEKVGVNPNQQLDVSEPETMKALCAAIIQQENGSQPYSDEQLSSGINAALGMASLPTNTKRYTGNAAFDAASPEAQARFLSHAEQLRKQQRQEYAAKIDISMKDLYAVTDEGLRPQSIPTETELMAAYGVRKGGVRYQDMLEQLKYGNTIGAAKELTPAARASILEHNRPVDVDAPGFAGRLQRWYQMRDKFNEFDKAWEVNQGKEMFSRSLQTNIPLDPSNKNNQAAADSYFSQEFSSGFNIRDNKDINTATAIISKSGIIPSQISSIMNAGARTKDSKVTMPVAELFGRIYDTNPAAVNEVPKDTQSYLLYTKHLTDAGVAPEQAIEQAYNATYNQTDVMRAQISDTQKTAAYKKSRNKAMGDFIGTQSQWLRDDPSADAATPEAARMRADFSTAYDENFIIAGGDEAIAKKMTEQQIGRVWAVSEVNGNARLMKYAPEALYNYGPKGWQAQQWEEEKYQLKYGMTKDEFAASSKLQAPDTGILSGFSALSNMDKSSGPAPLIDGELELVPDVNTPRNGDYSIMVRTDKDGIPLYQPYYGADGKPLRYKPDLSTSETYTQLVKEQERDTSREVARAKQHREIANAHRKRIDKWDKYFSWEVE
ncbi:hypothetical protein E1A40_08960 [Salmonella enterica subsp. enterica serovar Aba]|nr:hypothetical protein [Salmonella enterica subsp. enterica serovar Aba]EJN2863899.1 hypothetical protein [Salmonella enterica subsp. enterica serovar Yaba]